MRIGLFGGSFNPPHLAHLVIAETVRQQSALDKVLWMPAAMPPHKSGEALAPVASRLAMTQLATKSHPDFTVSDLEMRRSGKSYTADTLKILGKQYPNVDFHLIIGGDLLSGFHNWHRYQEILKTVSLIVYARPGMELSDVATDVLPHVTFVKTPLLDISSSDIRRRWKNGDSIRYLVTDSVAHYIKEQGLYRNP